MQHRKRLAIFFLSGMILLLWGNTLTIFAKAQLAKFLIADAWQKTLENGTQHKPWQWADTWPVGKMYFPKQRKTLFVLAGSHGSSLAFGPGHLDGTALPGELGTKVISAHRDTHFALLKHVAIGDIFLLQGRDGLWRYFRLKETYITDVRNGPWEIDPARNEVHLITCYPFNAITPGGPQRYVAIATPIFGGHIGSETPDHIAAENKWKF